MENGLNDKVFEVVDMAGNGICKKTNGFNVEALLENEKRRLEYESHNKFIKEYFEHIVTLDEVNKQINEFISFYKIVTLPRGIMIYDLYKKYNKFSVNYNNSY